jgi:hypothetical protein
LFKKLTFQMFVGFIALAPHALGQAQILGEMPAGTIDGTNSVFTLKNSPYPGTVAVYKNGLRQAAGPDFLASGNQLSFSSRSTPQPGDALLADYAALQTQAPLPAQYSRTITINHTKVPNTDQANFPVYLLLNSPALKTVANGGHVQGALGTDLAFYADAGLTQLLPFEIVSYNGVSGSLAAVVKCSTLSHAADTILYLAYGATGVTTSLANPTTVWTGYAGVYHLEDVTNNESINNSATTEGRAGNGSSQNPASAMTTVGVLGLGLAFNGASDHLDLGSYAIINGATALTYSGWVKFNALSEYAGILEKFDSTLTYGSGVLLSGHWSTSDRDWYTAVRASGSTGDTTNSFGIQTNAWYHFAYVYSAGGAAFYVNGVPVPLGHYGPANPPAVPSAALDLFVGAGLTGVLDELRVSTRAYTSDWIATEYNNQSNPSYFATLGLELP